MSDFIDIVEQARDGAPAGQRNVQLDADTLLVELVVRPAVGMAFLTGAPYAAALGVADALAGLGATGVGVAWPDDVCGPDGVMATVRTTAGYGEGMFVVCHVALARRDAADGDAWRAPWPEGVLAALTSGRRASPRPDARQHPSVPSSTSSLTACRSWASRPRWSIPTARWP